MERSNYSLVKKLGLILLNTTLLIYGIHSSAESLNLTLSPNFPISMPAKTVKKKKTTKPSDDTLNVIAAVESSKQLGEQCQALVVYCYSDNLLGKRFSIGQLPMVHQRFVTDLKGNNYCAPESISSWNPDAWRSFVGAEENMCSRYFAQACKMGCKVRWQRSQ